MGPEPRFEPESQDPQSRRMTAYPTPADKIPFGKNKVLKDYARAGIRTLVDLRQQVLSLSPLAARTPSRMRGKEIPKKSFKYKKCSDRDSNPSLRLERPK